MKGEARCTNVAERLMELERPMNPNYFPSRILGLGAPAAHQTVPAVVLNLSNKHHSITTISPLPSQSKSYGKTPRPNILTINPENSKHRRRSCFVLRLRRGSDPQTLNPKP